MHSSGADTLNFKCEVSKIVKMRSLETRAMSRYNWVEIRMYLYRHELDSSKQVEPRDEGQEIQLGQKTGSSSARVFVRIRDLCFALRPK